MTSVCVSGSPTFPEAAVGCNLHHSFSEAQKLAGFTLFLLFYLYSYFYDIVFRIPGSQGINQFEFICISNDVHMLFFNISF